MKTQQKKEIDKSAINQCYGCVFRKELSWSAHSECVFNWDESNKKPPQHNEHGLKNGWYNFPYNYDPVWQESKCEAIKNNE